MVRSRSYKAGSTGQHRPIKPVQAAMIINFRARGHTAPDCGCTMLTAVGETMLRLKATSPRRKMGTVGGDAGTWLAFGIWHLAFGNWHWPLTGLVVYHLLPLPEALGQTNLYITDRLSVDIFDGKVQLRPITARLSVFRSPSRLQDEIFILYTEVYRVLYHHKFFHTSVYKLCFHHLLQTPRRFLSEAIQNRFPYARLNLHSPASC